MESPQVSSGASVEFLSAMSLARESGEVVDSDVEETECGLGPCRGPRLQKLANKKSYLLAYSFLGLFQSMFFSYSIATLTTLEKQFKLNSQTTGILLSGNECSQIMLSLLLTYFGGQGHRPRLVSMGVVCSGISSLLIVIPHFVYGKSGPAINSTRDLNVCDVTDTRGFSDDCSEYDQSWGPMVYIFMSQFISGIGTTLFSTLGITYLDDNVKRKQTPMLIGVMSALRLIGPFFGYALAGLCNSMYVNLTEETTLVTTDPSWIGAWWLGFLVIGVGQLMTFWILALFPKRLPRAPLKAEEVQSSRISSKKRERTLKEFPVALRRLLTNKMVIFNNLSAVFYIFALSGYFTFLPKFIETQYEQSAARSGMVNGGISIVFMCTGLLLAGFVISRYRPRAGLLVAYDIVIGFFFVVAMVSFAFVKCDSKSVHGIDEHIAKMKMDDTYHMFSMSCNENCNCQPNRFKPVCSEDGTMNFFSACHAGCKIKNTTEDDTTIFTDCSCLATWVNSTVSSSTSSSLVEGGGFWKMGSVTENYCESNCFDVFLTYVLIMGVMKFFSSAGRVSGAIIGFRCVDEEDKSFAIGLAYLFVSLFAFIPSPIIYGAIIDQACKLWRTECGKTGNCWFYDPEKMRLYLHLTTAGFILIALVFDGIAGYYVRNLELYEEPEEIEKKNEQLQANLREQELEPMMVSRTPKNTSV